VANKRQRENRPIEREVVNAIRTFLDRHNIPFLEVASDVDFGKDVYIDLADKAGVTGRVIAVQAKGGRQTEKIVATGLSRGIRYSKNDATMFRESNIPVLGMSLDKERNDLLWVDLTAHCSAAFEKNGKDVGGFAEAANRLNDYHLPAFHSEMLILTKSSRNEIALDLASDDADRQRSAIVDCFGLGLKDPRPLLLVRRMLSWFTDPVSAKLAVQALTHLTSHPDILYHPGNTPSPNVEERVRSEMLWSRRELGFLLRVVEDEEEMWGRGVFGQHIVSLILANRHNIAGLIQAVADHRNEDEIRRRAFLIALYMASWERDTVRADQIIEASADLQDEWVMGVTASYRQDGYFDLY